MAEQFQYSGRKLEEISLHDERNVLFGYTSYAYNQQGKVRQLKHLESEELTNARVDYLFGPQPALTIRYAYADQSYSMDQSLNFTGGNVVSSSSFLSDHAGETSQYEYAVMVVLNHRFWFG